MTRILLKHRERLVAKHQAAIARWPSRTGEEFAREMQAVVRDLEAVARQADIASSDEMERTRTWRLVEKARADFRGDRTPEHDLADQLHQLQNVYSQAVKEGKVPPARQELLDGVLASFVPDALAHGDSEEDLRRSRSKISELLRGMAHAIADPSEGGPPLGSESRAGQIWSELARLKLALFREVDGRRFAAEESEAGMKLLVKIGQAGTSLYKARDDEELVRQQEKETLRRLAMEIRLFAVRDHLGVSKPALPASSALQDPNAVFFSGAEEARRCAAALCRARGLSLLGHSEPKDPAQTHWDHLHACNVGVFDLSAELAPVCYDLGCALALGRPVVITARRGTKVPFDVDIDPVWLDGGIDDSPGLSGAIDHAMYGLQRSGSGSSVDATFEHLRERFAAHSDWRVAHMLKSINERTARDAAEARRRVEDLLGAVGTQAPHLVFPAWPTSYPSAARRRCFHVSPFGPEWASITMEATEQASRSAGVEYVRGDRVLDPQIMRSIWDNLCMATHIVVDLTGRNANVALELGVARALGRNVLIITQDEHPELLFPAIAKVRMHGYSIGSGAGIQRLRDALSEFLCAAC